MTMTELSKRMSTKERVKQASLTMAVHIIMDRIQGLPKEDQGDLFKLISGYEATEDSEDRDSITATILEILEQKPIGFQKADFSETTTEPGLQKWIDNVSKRIRDSRKESGLTQEQLAEKSGLPQSHISRLEAGKHSPSHTTLEKIASALSKPVSDFDPSAD